MSVSGILNLNKPPGHTSFDIVAIIRKLTRVRRVGHGGTLDPLASGVLPICLGQATRITEYLAEARKTYSAQLVLGEATDTYDSEGKVTWTGDPSSITQERMEEVMDSFRGSIEQTPPMYSALKHQGKRLYELARAGVVVERKKRTTMIHRLKMVAWEPPLITIEVECGRGAYIRSLADDLGQALSCGAHLKDLVRLGTGPFDIKDSLDLQEFTNSVETGRWQEYLYPMDIVLQGMSVAIINPKAEKAALSGQTIPVTYSIDLPDQVQPDEHQPASEGESDSINRCRAYSKDGRFLAVLTSLATKGPWSPKKVFHQESG